VRAEEKGRDCEEVCLTPQPSVLQLGNDRSSDEHGEGRGDGSVGLTEDRR